MHKKMDPIKAYKNEDTNKQKSCYLDGYTWVSMLHGPSKAFLKFMSTIIWRDRPLKVMGIF